MEKIISAINKVGKQVFYNPTPFIEYELLVRKSLGPNTYRGFHKIKTVDEANKVSKAKSGSKDAFEKVLINNSKFIVDTLLNAKNESDINFLEKDICKTLKKELKNKIDNRQLNSFNKLRKPVDIVIEHLVAMGKDFSLTRQKITKHLFLPLDSQMFRSDIVFSDKEISKLRIKRSFTFKDIVDEKHYYEIQDFLKQKAKKLGIENRIYFDLVWGDRYKSKGKNLFATNP
ncbi:MAG: hypothetical protein M3352_05850 [Bacteroidota bacterium]|nr:hypothetical protein [Bacteroidota bacterium]